MRISIIQFSPSGNTAVVTGKIAQALRELPHTSVNVADVTADPDMFLNGNPSLFLERNVPEHDILLVGSPVYAHHFQYRMKEILAALPKPDSGKWGKHAIPYVTYGGISSGIALEEASKLLRRSGRTVVGGAKIVSSHRMTRAFLDEEFNAGKCEADISKITAGIADLVAEIASGKNLPDAGRKLRYQTRIKAFICNTVFDEKKWHAARYPKISINAEKCTGCGACVTACPVIHLTRNTDGSIWQNDGNPCIHCLNCASSCPSRAISLVGDIERGKRFMTKMIAKNGNREFPASEVIS